MNTPRLRALLVDDERLARKRLRDLLSRHPEIEIVGEADSLESARAAAEQLRPDLLFLDIDLSPGSGFDLLPELTFQPVVVFVTAYETFAVRAFDACAFDYLLKPVEPARLARTLERLLASLPPPGGDGAIPTGATQAPGATTTPLLNPAPLGPADPVALKDAGTVRIVETAHIVAIRAEGAYSRIFLRGASPMTMLRGISEWARLLPETFFARIDRSLIVQLSLVREVESLSRDEARVAIEGLPAPLVIGRVASLRLRRLLPTRG